MQVTEARIARATPQQCDRSSLFMNSLNSKATNPYNPKILKSLPNSEFKRFTTSIPTPKLETPNNHSVGSETRKH